MHITKRRIIHLGFTLVSLMLSFWMWSVVRGDFGLLSAGDIMLIITLAVFAIATLILAALLFSRTEAPLVYGAFALVFPLVMGVRWEYLCAALIALLCFTYAAEWTYFLNRSRLKTSFYPLISFGAPTMLTGVAALFAFAAYFYPFKVDTIAMPPQIISVAAPYADSLIGAQIPAYRPGMTLDQFIGASVAPQIPVGISKVNVDAAIAMQRAALGHQFGVTFTGKESTAEALTLVANGYVNKYLTSYKDFVPLVVAILVFLTVKSVGFIIDRLSVLVAWIASLILVATGVARKEKTTVEKEVLVI